jgi:hypothetical protein
VVDVIPAASAGMMMANVKRVKTRKIHIKSLRYRKNIYLSLGLELELPYAERELILKHTRLAHSCVSGEIYWLIRSR